MHRVVDVDRLPLHGLPPRAILTVAGCQRAELPRTIVAAEAELAVAATTIAAIRTVRTGRARIRFSFETEAMTVLRMNLTGGFTVRGRRTVRERAPSLRHNGDLPLRAPTGYRDYMTPDDKITPALSEARARRATLHDALVHLEVAISSPASGRLPEWTDLVRKEMVSVRDAFDQHVVVTEKPGGLYEEITERAPRLAGTVHRLAGEHPEITAKIAQMLERLDAVDIGGPEWPLDDARDDLQRFIGTVIRHRQKGADLVWEAYNVDIGGTE